MRRAKQLVIRFSRHASTATYDESYLKLLNETLKDEMSQDYGSKKLLSDSTRAFLNSVWYKDAKTNTNAKKNMIWLPAVTSYLAVLQRERKLKQAFHLLNVIKSNQIEWVNHPNKELKTDKNGVPEELYFALNKLMMMKSSSMMRYREAVSLSKYSLHMLRVYCTEVNSEAPSISFILRAMHLICKSNSLLMFEEALSIVFDNCQNLTDLEKKTIENIALLRFYQETDQSSKVNAHFIQNIYELTLPQLFMVQFELERLIERFLIAGNEDLACKALQKFVDSRFSFRAEDLMKMGSHVERLSLKRVNKTLLELFSDSYTPLDNTLNLNDVQDSDLSLILRILHESKIDFKKFAIDTDFMVSKVPKFFSAESHFLNYQKLLKPEFNEDLERVLFSLFIKQSSICGLNCLVGFLEIALKDDRCSYLFMNSSPEHNILSFFPSIGLDISSGKSTALMLYDYVSNRSKIPVKLTPYAFSVLFSHSLEGTSHADFFCYYYDFLKLYSKQFLVTNQDKYSFHFPYSIKHQLTEAQKILGNTVLDVQQSILDFYLESGRDAVFSDKLLEKIMLEHFVPIKHYESIIRAQVEKIKQRCSKQILAADKNNVLVSSEEKLYGLLEKISTLKTDCNDEDASQV